MPRKPENIYQLKIQLEDIRPPVWRRFLVSDSTSLEELHAIIQIIMGWDNYHMHQFIKGQDFFGAVDPEWGDDTLDEADFVVKDLLANEKGSVIYEYDFGDSWRHKITLEKILPFDKKQVLPFCVKGVRNCPPEDVGGVWGYEEFLDVLRDEKHPEHESMKEWAGGDFQPERFSLDEVNKALA